MKKTLAQLENAYRWQSVMLVFSQMAITSHMLTIKKEQQEAFLISYPPLQKNVKYCFKNWFLFDVFNHKNSKLAHKKPFK